MRRLLFYHLLLLCACAIGTPVIAEEALPIPVKENTGPGSRQNGMMVVEFREKSPTGSKLGDAIQQAKRELSPLESVVLPDESDVGHLLEGRSDIGMVVLVHPRDTEAMGKLPSLYPDIAFTIIDTEKPSYAANVQTVQFKEDEGVFLLGAIAAIRSTNRITIMAMEDTPHSHHIADIFRAGVTHIRPQASITSLLTIKPTLTQRTRLASTITTAFQEGTAVLFSMDDEIVEQALRAAKPERKIVISSNPPTSSSDTSRLMTYMVKRYDLALMDVLRIYSHKQWHAGTIQLGVNGGYVDYSLNAENVDIFPKEAIDRIEAIKDHISQGMYLTKP